MRLRLLAVFETAFKPDIKQGETSLYLNLPYEEAGYDSFQMFPNAFHFFFDVILLAIIIALIVAVVMTFYTIRWCQIRKRAQQEL